MATLTETAYYTKKILQWGMIGFVGLILVRALILGAIDLWEKAHPQPIAPPNYAYGPLPQIEFPKSTVPVTALTYSLENIEGKPPVSTPSARTYFIPKKVASLLAPAKAREFAARLGFTDNPQILSPTRYLFTDPGTKLRTLDLNIVNLNFSLKYDYTKDLTVFGGTGVPSPDQAISEAKNYAQLNHLFDQEIIGGKLTTAFLKYNQNTSKYSQVGSLSEADAIRVDFFRKDLDNLPVLPPGFDKSFIYMVFSGAQEQNRRIIEVNYQYQTVDYNDFATYPVISGDQAWQALNQGNSYIVSPDNTNQTKIVIRNIYLAYYDSPTIQNYLQPVYVFAGDNNFVAYLPAIQESAPPISKTP